MGLETDKGRGGWGGYYNNEQSSLSAQGIKDLKRIPRQFSI